MSKAKNINVFNIAFLDLLSGALGAVIILFIAVPKAQQKKDITSDAKLSNELSKKNVKENSKTDELKKLIQEQQKMIKELSLKKKAFSSLNTKLSNKLQDSIKQIKRLENEIKRNQSLLNSQHFDQANKLNEEGQKNIDVGFKFKGKRILFILDTSGSMQQEERIASVKAGLKMLITSMSPDFRIDVVSFPAPRQKNNYKELWGNLKPMSMANKTEIFKYLYNLSPKGRTPTRQVLRYAFKNYYGLSDIVLLTDGVPTKKNSNNQDDIYSILHEVNKLNKTLIQVNAIGVGKDFLKDKNSKAYIFLERLTKKNSGFFVGF